MIPLLAAPPYEGTRIRSTTFSSPGVESNAQPSNGLTAWGRIDSGNSKEVVRFPAESITSQVRVPLSGTASRSIQSVPSSPTRMELHEGR